MPNQLMRSRAPVTDGFDQARISNIQRVLNYAGYYTGLTFSDDGDLGGADSNTRQALRRLQAKLSLPQDGRLTQSLIDRVNSDGAIPIFRAESRSTPDQIQAAQDLNRFVQVSVPGVVSDGFGRSVANDTVRSLQLRMGLSGTDADGKYGPATRARMRTLGVANPAMPQRYSDQPVQTQAALPAALPAAPPPAALPAAPPAAPQNSLPEPVPAVAPREGGGLPDALSRDLALAEARLASAQMLHRAAPFIGLAIGGVALVGIWALRRKPRANPHKRGYRRR